MEVTRKIFQTHPSRSPIKRSSSFRLKLVMNMSIIITLMMITTSVNAFVPMNVNLNKALNESRITRRFFDVNSACSCRMRCNVLPSCAAAMIYTHTSGVLDCYLSEEKAFPRFELLQNASAITLLKPYTECPAPFALVRGAGCIKPVDIQLSSLLARKACQDMGGDIFSPDTDFQILPVYNYLNSIWNDFGLGWKFLVGINNRKWLDGRNVTNWYDGQPDGTILHQACGTLTHLGKMTDESCSTPFWFMCEMKVLLQ